ncbi:MAG: hotdog fold thioesterase [Nevskia sp.]
MSIWKQTVTIGAGLPTPPNTMGSLLGLKVTEVGPDYLRGTLPVDARTKQAFGRLHGGASCVLAEELGSYAANLCLDMDEAFGVGLDINANHLRAATGGFVTGTARPLHLGRATQVWEIRIEDEQARLVCISRLTMAIVRKSEGRPGG